MTSRKLLQIAVAIGGLVPVGAGLLGLVMGPAMVPEHVSVPISMDSHWRYLSGLLLGIGFAFWGTIPRIEAKTAIFQLLAAIVFIGGLGRLWGLLRVGVPDTPMLFGLAMELGVTPGLAIWQYLIRNRAT